MKVGDVEIMLADIGFHVMEAAIDMAREGLDTYEGFEDPEQGLTSPTP